MKKYLRFIAFSLAAVFILSVPWPAGVVSIQAASVNFAYRDRILVTGGMEGNNNSIPAISQAYGQEAEQAFLEWDFKNPNGSNLNAGTYYLRYNIGDHTQVIFRIQKDYETAKVTYRVYNLQSTGIEERTNLQTSTYSVYSYLDGADYVDYKDFTNTDQLGYVEQPPTEYPSFTIRAGGGFSIRVLGRTVHFLWDGVNDRINFVTDGLIRGLIYDFDLLFDGDIQSYGINYDLADPVGQAFFNRPILETVSLCIGVTGFESLPYANDGKGYGDILDYATEKPGADEVELELKFNIPLAWDDTTYQYSKSSVVLSDPLNLLLMLRNSDDKSDIWVEINDIYGQINANLLPLDAPAEVKSIERRDRNGDGHEEIIIRLGKMKAGQVYTSVSFQPVTVPVHMKTTEVDFGEVFTFLKYRMENEGGEFFVTIEKEDIYKGIDGFYYLDVEPPSGDAIVIPGDGESRIKIPFEPRAGLPINYRILFSESNVFGRGMPKSISEIVNENPHDGTANIIYSQQVRYIATSPTSLGVPKNFDVVSSKLRANENDPGNLGEVELTLEWDIAKRDDNLTQDILETMVGRTGSLTANYIIRHSLDPEIENQDVFANVEMKIYYDPVKGWAADYADGVATQIKVKPGQTGVSLTRGAVYRASVTLLIDAASINAPQGIINNVDLVYPNIYFLNVSLSPQDNPTTPSSVTLDDFSVLQIPLADNVKAQPGATDSNSEISLRSSWTSPLNSIRNYVDTIFKLAQSENDLVTYNLYISQNASQMEQFYRAENHEGEKNAASTVDYIAAAGNTLYFSQLDGVEETRVLKLASGRPALDSLRDNEVLRVSGIPLPEAVAQSLLTSGAALDFNYKLDGLDKNQSYYFCLETVISPNREGQKLDTGHYASIRYSGLSSIASETTLDDVEKPSAADKRPPAPTLTVVDKENPASGEVRLLWNKVDTSVDVNPDETAIIEYQLLRLEGNRMDDALLDTEKHFQDFWNEDLTGYTKQGWETSINDLQENFHLMEYIDGSFDTADENIYDFDGISNPLTMTDRKNLRPNTIYYYYIRTVLTVTDSTGSTMRRYSSWDLDAATTSPIKAPEDLRIVRDAPNQDKKTEVVFSFNAPIANLDDLDTEYTLRYQYRKDGGEWITVPMTDITALKASAVEIERYGEVWHTFTYKAAGLEPNITYRFRVNMVDREGNESLYTNEVQTKTGFDQDDYDKEEQIGNWLDELKDVLDKLLKDPYWISKDTPGLFEVVYRPSMFDALLAQNPDNLLQLVETGADKAVYYLPSSVVETANNRNVGFRIAYDDMDVLLSHSAVDTNYNNAVISIGERRKEKSVEDYYVRITLTRTEVSSLVEGEQPLTKQTDIQVEAVGSREVILKWDERMRVKLVAMIGAAAEDAGIKDEIVKAIENKTSNEEMVKLIADIVDDVKQDFIKGISSELSSVVRHSYSLDYLDAPVILVAKGLDPAAAVKAYQLIAGSYVAHGVENFGDNKAIYATAPGVYIFVGRTILIPGLDNMQEAGSLAGIIGKYGLDDFFGRDGAFSLEAFATRYQVVGSIARMAGAPAGAEPFAWLSQNKGLSLSTRNSNGNIQNQEAVYLVMVLYEVRTGTNVAAIQIRNYSLTAGMSGLSDMYKQSVRAAFELDICSSSGFNPATPIKVKEILEMLGSLDLKSRL